MNSVSDESLKKVESFIVKTVKERGNVIFDMTTVDMADGSGVALVTAIKAAERLQEINKLEIIKHPSRRVPITYVYKGIIEEFEGEQMKDDQITNLIQLVQTLKQEIEELMQENSRLQSQKSSS